MNVFVIGGDGFIGSHVCKVFLDHGHDVTVFGPKLQENLLGTMESQIYRVEGNILDAERLQQGMKTTKAEVVIHLAAFGAGKDGLAKSAQQYPKKAMDINVIGFFQVLEVAKNLGVSRVIWSGSSTLFGSHGEYEGGRVNEQSPFYPSSFYGMTKALDEIMTRYYRRQFGMSITGLRLPLVYGPGRWYKGAGEALVNLFEHSISLQKTTIIAGDEVIDLIYVKDAAEAFYHVACYPEQPGEVYNVKSHTTTFPELVKVVSDLVPGYPLAFVRASSGFVFPLMDTSLIERELGYKPKFDVQSACKDYIETLRRINH